MAMTPLQRVEIWRALVFSGVYEASFHITLNRAYFYRTLCSSMTSGCFVNVLKFKRIPIMY